MTEANELESKLRKSNTFSNLRGVESRLTNRSHPSFAGSGSATGSAEDPFGDLMDRVHRRTRGVEAELLNLRYFGLLLPMFGLKLGQSAIVLGAPASRVIVLDGGAVNVSEKGLKGLLGKLIAKLAEGPFTRREAIETVWGYAYEADRHDRLLSVAVSRIRKALGGGSIGLKFKDIAWFCARMSSYVSGRL